MSFCNRSWEEVQWRGGKVLGSGQAVRLPFFFLRRPCVENVSVMRASRCTMLLDATGVPDAGKLIVTAKVTGALSGDGKASGVMDF